MTGSNVRAGAEREVIGVERRWVRVDVLHLAIMHIDDDFAFAHVVHEGAGIVFSHRRDGRIVVC